MIFVSSLPLWSRMSKMNFQDVHISIYSGGVSSCDYSGITGALSVDLVTISKGQY